VHTAADNANSLLELLHYAQTKIMGETLLRCVSVVMIMIMMMMIIIIIIIIIIIMA